MDRTRGGKILMISFLLSIVLALNPDEMLRKADAFRSPEGGFEMKVRVEESSGDKSAFDVYIEGRDHSIIVTREPKRDLGRNMLMIDRDMWMFMPSINRSVRIALRQRLVGQVAQGDIARMKWTGDYKVSLVSNQPQPIEGENAYELNMKANKDGLTYDAIRLFVGAKDYRPLKALYMTPDEKKILKTAKFADYGPLGGTTRPRRITISDGVRSSESSVLILENMKQRSFPKGFFSQNNLARPKP